MDIVKKIVNLEKRRIKSDRYRRCYSSLSFPDLIKLYEEFNRISPEQICFTLEKIKNVFNKTELEVIKIVELGCHDGQLAKEILKEYSNIQSWIGYDICYSAVNRSRLNVHDDRFTAIALNDWFFNIELPKFNIFVCSHTLEHLNMDQVIKTLDHAKNAKEIILEIPVYDVGRSWRYSKSTHVLTENRETIRKILTERNYTCFYEDGKRWTTGWRKNDQIP